MTQALETARNKSARKLRRSVIKMPPWAPGNHADRYFRLQEQLLLHGRVRMAALVQANEHMFKPGKVSDDCVIVLSQDEDVDPDALCSLAGRVGALRVGDFDQPELRQIAAGLAPRSHWITGVAVPGELAPPGDCLVSYTMAMRPDLPGGALTGPLLPVLTLPGEPGVAMVVPYQYWPTELWKLWSFSPPQPTLGVGGLFGILLIGIGYLAAGMFAGDSVRQLLSGGLAEEYQKSPGGFLFLTLLNAVGLGCLYALSRKVPDLPALEAEDLAKRPWHAKITSLPLTERIAFGVWSLAYAAGALLGAALN